MIAQHPYEEQVQNFRPLKALVPTHWHSGSVEAPDGTTLHYTRTGGAKRALILLHGIQVSGLMWLRTAQALEATYDVVMPDFRGHGRSGGLEKEASADTLVSDIQTVIRLLGLDMPFVIGHSLGADIAGRLAAITSLRGVILVDPALQNFGTAINFDTPPVWMQPILAAMEALKTQIHSEQMLTGLRLLPPGTKLWHEADYVSFVEGQAQFNPAFFRYTANLGYLFEAPDVIANITCPLLLLTAQTMFPGANTQPGLAAFTANWHNGQHQHFAESGHFIPFDQFEPFIEVVREFLGGA